MCDMEEKFFTMAHELAAKAVGFTSPNPCVGAVVVKKGKVIGVGYHKKSGTAHAEVVALQNAQENGYTVKDAEIYVTLEPCCHVGKTPACTDLLIRSQIKKVYVGMKDPFKMVNRGGIKVLRNAGIEVEVLAKSDPLSLQIRLLNQPFIKWAMTGLPYVTVKAAVTLDGKIATSTHDSKWITSEMARNDSRIERSFCDAVLVGSGTVKADNPELAPHGKYAKKSLLRVIIDPDLSTSVKSKVYRDEQVFVATTARVSPQKVEEFKAQKIAVESLGPDRILFKTLLQEIGKKNVQHLFVEGGSVVHGSFVDEAKYDPLIIDRVIWYIAPKLIGGSGGISAIGGVGIEKMNKALHLKNIQYTILDEDIKVSGFLNVY